MLRQAIEGRHLVSWWGPPGLDAKRVGQPHAIGLRGGVQHVAIFRRDAGTNVGKVGDWALYEVGTIHFYLESKARAFSAQPLPDHIRDAFSVVEVEASTR
jgi:hypothetical protein